MEIGLLSNSMSFGDSQHDASVLENLRSQQESGRFCDVILHVEGKVYYAHRCILAANSPYFDSVLKAHKIIKEQYNVSCQNQATFQLFLKFLYTGSVLIDQDNILELLNLASTLLIFKLQLYCSEYLENSLTVDNCLYLQELADKYCLKYLKNTVSHFIDNHLMELFKGHELLSFPLQKLESFLNTYICTIPQESLMVFIADWIKFNFSQRERDLRSLLTFVDWKVVNQNLILNHIQNEMLYVENERCLFVFLEILGENKIKVPSLYSRHQELKAKFQPILDDKINSSVIIDMAISLALSGLQTNASPQVETGTLTSEPSIVVQNGMSASETIRRDEQPNGLIVTRNLLEQGDDIIPDININQIVPTHLNVKDLKINQTESRHKRKIDCPRKIIPSTSMATVSALPAVSPDSERVCPLPSTVGNLPSVVSAYLESTDEYDVETESSDDNLTEETKLYPLGKQTLLWKEGVKCPHCSYVAHSSIRFEQHLARAHTKNMTYKCSLCGFSSKWNQDYNSHMKVHFSGPPFNCESCDYSCDKIQRLMTHRMIHIDDKPYKCGECDFSCLNKGSMTIHMRCHTGVKPFRCGECGRRFTAKHFLEQHKQCHKNDRPFNCDTCDFSTKSKDLLASHVHSHTGDIFHCDFPQCTFTCTKKSQLTAHAKCHRSMRSHICTVCGRGFAERSHLVRHERIHLTDKPFKCNDCDYTSSRRDKLKEHVQKHHSADATAKLPYKPRCTRRLNRNNSAHSSHRESGATPFPSFSPQAPPVVSNTNLNIYNYDQCSTPNTKQASQNASNSNNNNNNNSLNLFPHFQNLLPHLSNTALSQPAFFPTDSRLEQLMADSPFGRYLARNHNRQSSHSFHPPNMPQDLTALGAYMSLF